MDPGSVAVHPVDAAQAHHVDQAFRIRRVDDNDLASLRGRAEFYRVIPKGNAEPFQRLPDMVRQNIDPGDCKTERIAIKVASANLRF